MSVQCQDVVMRYRGGFTLGPLSLTCPTGVTALVGVNGAGKSTLFKILAGVVRPESGGVTYRADRPGIGYMPQDVSFPMHARCGDYLAHVAWLAGVPRAKRWEQVAELLSRVGLETKGDSRIASLSGGMRRRLGLAQTLLAGPGLLLLDEPTAGLDPQQRVLMRAAIASCAAERTVVISTHLIEDLQDIADRVLVMREGGIVFDGTLLELEATSGDGIGSSPLERSITALMAGGVQR